MIKIGMKINDRYEVLEKIGTGGMSDVYKAKDHKLNRFVAMKVLKQEFSENANFVSKFVVEAQAAAGLMHPNIVNVYDVGEENGINYIVMELVEGITLKKYIEKKARLSYKEAVSIAIQVSMGIEAAHNNHIIHRDIKPQNIIISKDGKVKVTDFGIAKAATSNTITSNVMGSVHYTSPEQARGGYSDEKSDIYSLGITLFEMLTGRVPFNGETTVAIAIKHIQEEMPSPAEFVPEIPSSVESIVLKCCQKSPDRRYQNMQELIADLKQSLMNPDEDFVIRNEPDMEGGTRMISEGDVAQIKRHTAYPEYVEQDTMRLRSETEPYDEDPQTEDGDEYDYNPKMERMTTILAVLGGIAICGIAIFLAVKVFGNMGENNLPSHEDYIITTDGPDETKEPESQAPVTMPYVIGKTVEDARNALTDAGLKSRVDYEESDTVDAGVVMGADAEEGQELQPGSVVTLVASAGPSGIPVPSVLELSYEMAEKKLTDLGFSVIRMENYSDTVEAGYVVSQLPEANSTAAEGAVITLTVSLGKEAALVQVPNLIGFSETEGRTALTEQGLTVGNVAYEYSVYEEGDIFYQSYSAGTYVDPGTMVDIRISKGPEPTSTPQPVTYRCNLSILSPAEEDQAYVANTPVQIKLVANDGKVLLETTATTFPQTVNYYNLSVPGGTVTLTYTVEVETTPAPEEEGGGETPVKTTETRTITRNVTFVEE